MPGHSHGVCAGIDQTILVIKVYYNHKFTKVHHAETRPAVPFIYQLYEQKIYTRI